MLRQAGRLLLLGVPVGLAAAAGAGKLLQAVLVGASPTEPLVYAAAVAFVVVIAVLAAWIPAWRASRVDLMVALRSE